MQNITNLKNNVITESTSSKTPAKNSSAAKIARTKTSKIKTSKIEYFRKKRYIAYIFITLFVMVLPFIRLNEAGNHIFLLSFDRKVLQLMGIEYSIQEFYVMPFMLIILFVGIFLMTSMGGRVWCGWGCPQTIYRMVYRDILQTRILKLRKKIENKQEILNLNSLSKQLRYALGLVIFALLALIASANFLFFFVPPEDFFAYLSDVGNHQILLGFWLVIAGFILFEVCFIAEKFCIYMCPYARVQSVLFDDNTLMSIYNQGRGGAVYKPNGEAINIAPKKQDSNNECLNCLKCVNICPTHIDIRKGVQLECINCLECVDACSDVMARFNKPSLVSWSSPNAVARNERVRLFRAKTIGYIVLLCVVFIALVAVSNIRKSMLLNINRDARLYTIRDSGAVDNAYTFLIQNKDSVGHKFNFEIVGDIAKKFEIRVLDYEGEDGYFIDASGDKRLTVLIRAKENLNDSGGLKGEITGGDSLNPKADFMDKDQNIPLTIKAFALDDKDRINITYNTFFMYPSRKNIENKLRR